MSDIVVGRYLTEIAAKLIWIRQHIAQVILSKYECVDKVCVVCFPFSTAIAILFVKLYLGGKRFRNTRWGGGQPPS